MKKKEIFFYLFLLIVSFVIDDIYPACMDYNCSNCPNNPDICTDTTICKDKNCNNCSTTPLKCKECNIGFTLGITYSCNKITCNDNKCKLCEIPQHCISCDNNYGVDLGNQKCTKCSGKGCRKCTILRDGNQICNICSSDYFSLDGKISKDNLDNITCVSNKCNKEKCKFCSSNNQKCQICKDGYTVDNTGSCCLNSVINDNYQCISKKCDKSRCSLCSANNEFCILCNADINYVNTNGECVPVSCLPDKCEKCNQDKNNCIEFNKCDPEKCISCKRGIKARECTNCNSRYILNRNNECIECKSGSQGVIDKCIQNCDTDICKKCSSESGIAFKKCIECYDGFVLDSQSGFCFHDKNAISVTGLIITILILAAFVTLLTIFICWCYNKKQNQIQDEIKFNNLDKTNEQNYQVTQDSNTDPTARSNNMKKELYDMIPY